VSEKATPLNKDAGSNLDRVIHYRELGFKLVRDLLRGDGEKQRTQRRALLAFSLRVASAAIAYLSQVFLARWMGSHEYGIFVFVWVWVLILSGLSSLGLNTSLIRFIPEYKELGEYPKLRGVIFSSIAITLLTSTVVALLGLAGLYFFSDYMQGYYVLPGYLALVCIPLFALTDVGDSMCRAKSWILLGLLPPYVLRPLMILLCMVAAYFYGLPMVATTAVGAAIIATWSAGLGQMFFLRRRLVKEVPSGDREFDLGFWLKVSLPILLINGSEVMLQNTDVIVISHYMSPTDVAIYFAALKTMSLISFVHYAVGAAVGNRFSALKASGADGELKAFIRQSVHWTFWPSLVSAIAILALGWPLLYLFGEKFTSGYPVMFVLALGFLVRASMGPAEMFLNMLGEHRRCAAIFFISVGFNLVMNIVLVKHFGLMGAAVSTSASMMLAATMFYYVAKRYLGVEIAIWRHFRG